MVFDPCSKKYLWYRTWNQLEIMNVLLPQMVHDWKLFWFFWPRMRDFELHILAKLCQIHFRKMSNIGIFDLVHAMNLISVRGYLKLCMNENWLSFWSRMWAFITVAHYYMRYIFWKMFNIEYYGIWSMFQTMNRRLVMYPGVCW